MNTLTEEHGTIHAAKVDNSPRLQRVLEVLLDYKPHTTRDIIRRAFCCAVNSCISELRENGYEITCNRIGRSRYEYVLVEETCRVAS